MTITQIAAQVLADKQARQVRLMRGIVGQPKLYAARPVPYCTGRPKGWTTIDPQTALAIMAVYNSVHVFMRSKIDTIPLATLVDFCWRVAA